MGNKPIALIVGVGVATGAAIARLWAAECTLVMVARSDAVIGPLAQALPDAHAFQCDVSDRAHWEATLQQITAQFGVPQRILVNTESAAWGAYHELSLEQLEMSFRVNVIAVLQMVQVLFPKDGASLDGVRIMISSSPAAYQPPPQFLGLAPSRVAQRVLAELLHDNMAALDVQFCVYSINGAIDEPKMRAAYPNQSDDFFIAPETIAAAMARVFASDPFVRQAEIKGLSAFA